MTQEAEHAEWQAADQAEREAFDNARRLIREFDPKTDIERWGIELDEQLVPTFWYPVAGLKKPGTGVVDARFADPPIDHQGRGPTPYVAVFDAVHRCCDRIDAKTGECVDQQPVTIEPQTQNQPAATLPITEGEGS